MAELDIDAIEQEHARIERIARRMQAVYGGATARTPADNSYDWAKDILASLARLRELV